MSDLRKQLIAYGLDLLGQAAGQQEAAAGLVGGLSGLRAGWTWEAYEKILGPRPTPEQALSSIFSWVAPPDLKGERHLPETAYYAARALALDRETLFPCTVQTSEVLETSEVLGERLATAEEAWAQSDLGSLWRGFEEEYRVVQECFGSDDDAFFEGFYHLYHKYAWALPCSYGEPGVSLFQQWKTVAALAFVMGEKWADGPADKFTLIGGDIPGIQDFVYTITSKGAAKGLRGRSFFLQLLGDAVVRRLVTDLGLCSCNVVYAAGGNFLLLAPASSEAALKEWQKGFNRDLLDEFEGDLYLALAWEELSQPAVGTSEFADVREQLGKKVAAAKSRRFAEVVEAEEEIEENRGWAILFEPKGQGGLDYCQVCQREPRPGERLVTETTEAGETVTKCERCRSFEGLARDIAHGNLWMVVTEADPATQNKGWQGALAKLTRFGYRFQKEAPHVSGPVTAYVLNPANPKESHGRRFRFVANVTPRIEEADRQWVQDRHPDLELPRGEPIKDFALMALQSEGITRVGVLRMDVDNLGAIFGQYLRGSMAQTSALSAALELFFAGHLNRISRDVAAQGKHGNTLYIIYAGGDDLFVVGSWDRMPILAERIRKDFTAYTGNNPHLTLSGGVALEGRKFPLYRAAERAGEAEGRAKKHRRPGGRDKDAFCFLGQVVAWGKEWELLRKQKDNLLWLVGEDEENRTRKEDEREKRLDRALLQVVRSVHQLYYTGLRETRRRAQREKRSLPDPRMFLGRWMWMHAYSLARIARRSRDEEVKRRIMELQKTILQPETVYLGGLAARWVEYLTRKEK